MNPIRVLALILIFLTTLLVACGPFPTPTAAPTPIMPPVIPTAVPTPAPTPTVVVPPGMVIIPGGAFQMGSNQDPDTRPVHPVILNAFLMDRYEVTNGDYLKCEVAKKCAPPADKSSATRGDYYSSGHYAYYPVVNVSWFDADTYCKWRGRRLPTEAEWERAARGGVEGKPFPWGDAVPNCTPGTSNGAQIYNCPIKDTIVIASFAPNPYGLFDMSGNVWEWVSDWYTFGYYSLSPGSNPQGPEGGEFKVLRGGGWFPHPELQLAYRYNADPTTRYNFIGFRCAGSIP